MQTKTLMSETIRAPESGYQNPTIIVEYVKEQEGQQVHRDVAISRMVCRSVNEQPPAAKGTESGP